MPIITSLLDTDLYKHTMRKAILRHYLGIPVRYDFINRRTSDTFNEHLLKLLRHELDWMAGLRLTDTEADWLIANCPYLGREYVESLRPYRFNPDQITAAIRDGQLHLSFEGPWDETVLWEVPLLATISELHCSLRDLCQSLPYGWLGDQKRAAVGKAHVMVNAGVTWSDLGTRRRHSYEVQDTVVGAMVGADGFAGTSNPHLAMKYGLRPIGTMAHEWIMGVGALEGNRHANRHALYKWADVYQGDLGIALTDTFGTDAFWGDFDLRLAKLFDGIRQDSGDPLKFAARAAFEYKARKIDGATKTVVFSDGLTVETACWLRAGLHRMFRVAFGIGTNLTNDFEGRPALQIVIKLTKCGGVPVVKLSDTPTKATGDRDALRVARWEFFGTPLDAPGQEQES